MLTLTSRLTQVLAVLHQPHLTQDSGTCLAVSHHTTPPVGLPKQKAIILYGLRRTSDNTEQDIGFDSNGDLDTTALLAFVGTGGTDNGFVVKWYDQTGNADLVQSSASNQPIIVSNGSVVNENGKPTITFDYSSSNHFSAEPEDWGFVTSSNTSIFMVMDLTQYSTPRSVLYNISGDEVSSGHGDTLIGMARSNSLRIGFHDKSAGSWTPTPDGFFIGVDGFAAQQNLISSIYNSSGALDSYANNTIEGTNSANPEGSITANKFYIGSNSSGTNPMDGNMQEFIIFNSDETSNRTSIEGNINDHFDIYS